MKKIFNLILCLMLGCLLVGCTGTSYDEVRFETVIGRPFMVIRVGLDDLYVDINERTQYVQFRDTINAGLTLLLDSEGKPLLYEGEIPYENYE